MATVVPEHHPLRQLFGALTERTFAESLGWPDFQVTGYVSNLLVEFAHVDQLTQIRNQEGQPLEAVVELLYEAETLNQDAEERKNEMSIATLEISPSLWLAYSRNISVI